MEKQLVLVLADLGKRLVGVVNSQIHYAVSYTDSERRKRIILEGLDALENVVKRARRDIEKLFDGTQPAPAQAEGE